MIRRRRARVASRITRSGGRNRVATGSVAAHDAASAGGPAIDGRMEGLLVEAAIGIALVVLSAVLILGIVRVVSANLDISK